MIKDTFPFPGMIERFFPRVPDAEEEDFPDEDDEEGEDEDDDHA